MKKTFISPVAQIVAAEVETIIATSTIEKVTGNAGDAGEARSNTGGNNSTSNAANPINVEALDF